MKKYLIIALLAAVVLSAGVVVAGKPGPRLVRNVIPSKGLATVTIPSQAVEVAPGVFSLGVAVDHDGRLVQGYAFVDYKKGFGRPGATCGNGVCEKGENAKKCPGDCADGGGEEPDASSCYGFLSKGAKWRVTESYVVASNIDAIATDKALDAWDNQVSFEVFGNQDTISEVDGADLDEPDGKNEVMFGEISNPGVIAVAIVWGIFRGPPSTRELIEWDVVFDNIDYPWGDGTLDSTVMDFENIATHEFGHSVGLDDLYTTECSEQTMYGRAAYGETKKQTLEVGDKKGIQQLYK